MPAGTTFQKSLGQKFCRPRLFNPGECRREYIGNAGAPLPFFAPQGVKMALVNSCRRSRTVKQGRMPGWDYISFQYEDVSAEVLVGPAILNPANAGGSTSVKRV